MALQREHIVEEAMKMFVAEGIKSVRMDDIAQRLCVSKRTLYEMFGDKETLLYEAMERYGTVSEDCHAELVAQAGDVLEEIFVVLKHVMASSSDTRRMSDNLRKFYPAVWEKLVEAGNVRSRDNLRDKLMRGIDDGLFRDDFNIDLAISMLHYTATVLMARSEIMIPAGMTEERACEQILGCFFRGLATPKGQQLIEAYVQRYQLL